MVIFIGIEVIVKGKEMLKEKMEKEEEKKEKDVKVKEEKSNKKSEKSKEKKSTEAKKKQKQEKDKFKPVKKENEKEKKDKNKKGIIAFLILIVLIFIFSVIFALINVNNSNIIKGVTIQGIDVSNLSKDDAANKIKQIYDEKLKKEIEVKYEDYSSAIDLNLLETTYDINKAAEEAFNIGKKDNIFVNNYEILKTYLFKSNIELDISINEDVANQTIEDIGAKLPGIVVESSYYIEDSNLIIGKGKKGIVIDKEKLLNQVKDEIKKTEITQDYLDIPIKEKDPDPIDIEKIHSEVYKEVQDAYITRDPFEVHPEVDGIDFDVEAAKAILAEEKEEYIIPLTVTKASVTLSQLGTEAFPNQLATFTTRYDASNVDRTTNLRLACQKLNGKVVLPGETFSYNKTLGERTVAAGYRNGKVYENGQVVDGIGGGICQISSTLYNSVLMANLEIVERRNHQFVTSYLPAGRDATVVYGAIDFKFKNTRQYPIRITASVSNGIATVSIYGIKEAEEYTVSFTTRTISTIPPTTKYEEDASIPAGEEKVKQNGTNGLVTETYITKTINGVSSTKLLSRDTYSAMQKIISKGTGSSTKKEETNTNKTTENKQKKDTNTATNTTKKDDKTSKSETKNETKKDTRKKEE